jgi:hypothetical protein
MFEGLKTAPPGLGLGGLHADPGDERGVRLVLLRQGMSTAHRAGAGRRGGGGDLGDLPRRLGGDPREFEIGPGEAIFFWGCVAHAAYTPLVRL